MKNKKKALSAALFVVLVALLAWYLYQNREDLRQLLALNAQTVTWMLLLATGACVMNAVYHKLILDTYQLPLTTVDWLGVVMVAHAVAYVLPMRADLVFSAAYYKRTKGFDYVKSASVAAGNIVFGVLFSLLQMFLSLLCTGLIEGVWPGVLWVCFIAATAICAAFLWLCIWSQKRIPSFVKRSELLMKLINGFYGLLRNRALLWRLLLCLTINNLMHLLLYMACFRGVGMEATLYEALFYASISRLISMVAIVPGNIGIKEGVLGVAGALMGDVFQNGVMVSLLHSVALMAVYIIGGAVFALPVWQQWNTAGKKA